MPTNYPGSLDSLARPSSTTAMNATGYEGDVVIDSISDAIEAVQAELGTDPAGGAATVKARLDALDFGAFGHFYWPSGGYISNAVADGITTTTATLTNNVLYFVPIFVPVAATVTTIMVQVTSAATGNAYLGLYATDAGAPAGLVVDGGTFSTSTTGVKTVTVSSAVASGLYWVAVVFSANGVVLAAVDVDASRIFASDNAFGKYRGFTQAHTYGALPSSAGTLTLAGGALVGLGRS